MRSDKNDPQKVVFDGSMADAFGLHRTDSGVSQSGYEHNNVFLSRGDQFRDVSGVSGFDHVADGRALSRFDYDRDGWLDLALAVVIFTVSTGVTVRQSFFLLFFLCPRFCAGSRVTRTRCSATGGTSNSRGRKTKPLGAPWNR